MVFGYSSLRAVWPHGVRALGCKGFVVLWYSGLRVRAQGLSVGRGVFGL